MKQKEIRPLPKPTEGQPIDLSGGPISIPDFILGFGLGGVGTFIVILILWALEQLCRCT